MAVPWPDIDAPGWRLDGDTEIAEDRCGVRLDLRFCGLAEVGRIAVEDVVILDPRLRGETGLKVPHRLEQASGDKPRIRQIEEVPPREDGAIHGVPSHVAREVGAHGA